MAKKQEEGKSRLKDFIDNNSLAVLTAFAISAGGVVAGVMTYYTNQRLDIAEAQHKAELSRLETKDQEKIVDLTSRIVSIERRIPGTVPEYLDVTTITIGSERVRALNTSYKSFADGRFYVSVPREGGWNFVETSFLQVFEDENGLSGQQIPQPLANALQSEKVYMWQGASSLKFEIKPRILTPGSIPHPRTLSFSPSIIVEHIDDSILKKRIGAIAGILLDFPENNVKQKSQSVAQALDNASKDLQQGSQKPEDSLSLEAKEGARGAASLSGDVETKRRIVNVLENIYSSDVATYTLMGLIADAMQEDFMLGVKHRFSSMQRKGNVWYLQYEVIFPDVKMPTGIKSKNNAVNISIDEEIFFCGYGSGGLLIRIYLPRTEGMSENATWAASWLLGLRIPAED